MRATGAEAGRLAGLGFRVGEMQAGLRFRVEELQAGLGFRVEEMQGRGCPM